MCRGDDSEMIVRRKWDYSEKSFSLCNRFVNEATEHRNEVIRFGNSQVDCELSARQFSLSYAKISFWSNCLQIVDSIFQFLQMTFHVLRDMKWLKRLLIKERRWILFIESGFPDGNPEPKNMIGKRCSEDTFAFLHICVVPLVGGQAGANRRGPPTKTNSQSPPLPSRNGSLSSFHGRP